MKFRFTAVVLTLLICKSSEASHIQIKDIHNVAVPSCLVQVGQKPQTPFTNNLSITNTEGDVFFNQITLIDSQPITIVCPKRATVTYLSQTGQDFILYVGDLLSILNTNIEAHFQGWNNVGQNGNIDLSLITPTIFPQNIFSIKWADLVSPIMDTMSVFGKDFEVPQNMYIPKQKVKYGLLSTQIEKSHTAFLVDKNKKVTFMGLAGKLPSSELIQTYLGSDVNYFDLINFMDFYSLSISETAANSSSVDIIVNQYGLKYCFSAQAFNVPPNLKPLGASLYSLSPNTQSPWAATDIKLLSATPQKLKCLKKQISLPSFAVLATNEDTSITSQILVRKPTSTALSFNSFFPVPKLKVYNSGKTLEVSKIDAPSLNFKPIGYQATLSDDKAGVKWIVFSDKEKFDLPELPAFFSSQLETSTVTKHKWEVMWLGVDPSLEPQSSSQNFDFNFYGVATHASKNSITF